MLVREGSAAERERPAGLLRMAREDLDHSGERRHAVERPLRALHDLDPVDVLDGNLGERRVERAARGNAVHRDEKRVEFLQAPDPDVREPAAVVGRRSRCRDPRRPGARPRRSSRPGRAARRRKSPRREPRRRAHPRRTLRRRDDHRRARSGPRGSLREKRRVESEDEHGEGTSAAREELHGVHVN